MFQVYFNYVVEITQLKLYKAIIQTNNIIIFIVNYFYEIRIILYV